MNEVQKFDNDFPVSKEVRENLLRCHNAFVDDEYLREANSSLICAVGLYCHSMGEPNKKLPVEAAVEFLQQNRDELQCLLKDVQEFEEEYVRDIFETAWDFTTPTGDLLHSTAVFCTEHFTTYKQPHSVDTAIEYILKHRDEIELDPPDDGLAIVRLARHWEDEKIHFLKRYKNS